MFSYHTCSLSYVAPKLSKNEKNLKILRNFRKNGQNLNFLSVQSKSKRANRTMKFGDLQRFLVNKSIFWEIFFQKLFRGQMAILLPIVIKKAFFRSLFSNSNKCCFWQHMLTTRSKSVLWGHICPAHQPKFRPPYDPSIQNYVDLTI